MPFELDVFQRVITGPLSPLYFSEQSLQQPLWYSPLRKIPTRCIRQIHARFAEEDGKPVLQQVRSWLLDKHRLPTFLALKHIVHPDQAELGEAMLTQTLRTCSLEEKDAQEWYHWQDQSGELHLECYATYSLDHLSPEELRYHYYQLLLDTHVSQVQQRMMQTVHGTTSAKKTNKYVQDHQQTLINYTTQVLQYLDEKHPQVYTLSDAYTIPDIYKLVYYSLEELIEFIEQQFTQYLDTRAPVPYRHRVLQSSRLTQQLAVLQPALSNAEISSDLLAVLDEPFGQIQQLATQATTYVQLRYFRQLLQGLTNWSQRAASTVNAVPVGHDQQQGGDEESLLALLFHLNFNSTALLEWFISTVQSKLDTSSTPAEKLSLLYYYRKFCKQLPVQRQYAYRSAYPGIDERILSWMNEEISYQEKEVATDQTEPAAAVSSAEQPPLDKIKTNLSVPQIALLVRMFLAPKIEIFPEQNQNNIYKQLSSTLQSTHREDISEKSLRDRFYKADRHSVAVLKDKVIAMLNYLNGLP